MNEVATTVGGRISAIGLMAAIMGSATNKSTYSVPRPPRTRWSRPASMAGVFPHPHYGFMRAVDPGQMSEPVQAMVKASPRQFVTRNSPCPCGRTTKRFKNCCGKA